jgi:hypothetical protein
MSSEVPQLSEFHEVIYRIWHEAWPHKNTEMLAGLIPEIDSGFVKLTQVKLPPLLHEKQGKWTEGVTAMGKIIEQYKAAAVDNNASALLNAAENLHSQYEVLVRTVRPVLKEIDGFHQELYMLYHYYILEYNLNTMTACAERLVTKMEILNKAELPKKYKIRQEQFNKSRTDLSKAVNTFNQLLKDKADKETILAAVEEIHSDYQKLTALFE